jgi:hypothetical protein
MSTAKKAVRGRAPATAAAPAPATETKPDTPHELLVERPPGETREALVARIALGPAVPNALTALTYAKREFGTISLSAAWDALNISVKAVQSGDLGGVEAMLVSQATALNSIFNDLAMRSQVQSQMAHLDTFMRLALKAQNQCRMTLETLATVKNPPVVFARQANISHGPQQVNNGAAPGAATHAAKIETARTELLEAGDGKRLDAGATGKAGGADPHMETVGAVHGAAHR